jgi:hypothetical protein
MSISEQSNGVKVTTIRISDSLHDALSAEATREGTTVSGLIREGALLRMAFAAAIRTGEVDLGRVGEELRVIVAEMREAR